VIYLFDASYYGKAQSMRALCAVSYRVVQITDSVVQSNVAFRQNVDWFCMLS
jgi:hypothetical protein